MTLYETLETVAQQFVDDIERWRRYNPTIGKRPITIRHAKGGFVRIADFIDGELCFVTVGPVIFAVYCGFLTPKIITVTVEELRTQVGEVMIFETTRISAPGTAVAA